MQPEIRETFKYLERTGRIQPIQQEYGLQLSEFLICCGFFLVYIIEEIVHFVLDKSTKSGQAELHQTVQINNTNNTIQRTLSLQRYQNTFPEDIAKSGGGVVKIQPPKQFQNVTSIYQRFDVENTANEYSQELTKLNKSICGKIDNAVVAISTSSLQTFDTDIEETEMNEMTVNEDVAVSESNLSSSSKQFDGDAAHKIIESTLINVLSMNEENLVRQCTNTPAQQQTADVATPQPPEPMLSTSSTSSPSKPSLHQDDIKGMMRGLMAVLALSIHAIFEGLAVGLEENLNNVWYMFVAIATHKLVIIFCVGMELSYSNVRIAYIVVYVVTFSIVTPIGIGIGAIVHASGVAAIDPNLMYVISNNQFILIGAVLQALSAGTLLYVIFFEVLVRDRLHLDRSHRHHATDDDDDDHHHHHYYKHYHSQGQQEQNELGQTNNYHDVHENTEENPTNGFFQLFSIMAGFLFMFVLHLLTKCKSSHLFFF